MSDHRPIERILPLLRGVKKIANGWIARCPVPGHGKGRGDVNPSLSLAEGRDGRVLIKCFAGCSVEEIVDALGLRMADLFPRDGQPRRRRHNLTVESLARAKGLPADYVRQYCEQARPGVIRIVYRLPDGKRAPRHRLRGGTPEDKEVWWEGGRNGPKPVPYGLDRLADARKAGYLVIVEGETDCWTLWYYGIPALGLPGATTAGKLTREYLDGIRRVYIWRETDRGGQQLVSGVARQLAAMGWDGEAYVIGISGVKDPNDLHRRNPGTFVQAFQRAIERAEPLPLEGAVTDKEREPVPEDDAEPTSGEDPLEPKQPRAAAGGRQQQKTRLTGGDSDTIPGGAPGKEEHTDLGNAKRFVRLDGDNIRYVPVWGRWLIWDGTRWREDDTNEIYCRAQMVIEDLLRQAQNLLQQARKARSKKKRDALLMEVEEITTWARRTESKPRLYALVELAGTLQEVTTTPDVFDRDPWLLNCPNGTVDLRTGELRPHRREDMLTKTTGVPYDPDAKAPLWEAFLHRVMDGNQNLIRFLQRAAGMSLVGVIRDHVLLICYGTGANGKSTFLETLCAALGDYAMTAAPDLLMARQGERHPTELADLFGKRLVVAMESDEGRRLNEALVKRLTGGDTIKARRMREDFWSFRPSHTLWLATNHKPIVRGTDHAIWRRLRLIPFNVTIPPEDQDPDLPAKLRQELPGILAWAVRGCLEWQRQGLNAPTEVLGATSDYRAEMDVLAAFLDSCCVRHPAARAKASELYEAYVEWCEANGERPLSQREFGVRLAERGFERIKSVGQIHWLGLGLLADRDDGEGRDQNSASPAKQDSLYIVNPKIAPYPPYPPHEEVAPTREPDDGWEEGEL